VTSDERGKKFQNVYYRRATDRPPIRFPEPRRSIKVWHFLGIVLLFVAIMIAFSGCAPTVHREIPYGAQSVVTYRVPRFNHFKNQIQWSREEAVFETIAEAEDFVDSFTAEERSALDVQRHVQEVFFSSQEKAR
jgi:hypothetical protein